MTKQKWRPKMHKYRAKPCRIKGVFFASKKEAMRWLVLQDMEAHGEIENLRRQVKYPLNMPTSYIADFVYTRTGPFGGQIVEDSKGFKTREYLRKKKLMAQQHGIEIKEV